MQSNISEIRNEITDLKEKASDTDATIDDINGTMIDTIDKEIENILDSRDKLDISIEENEDIEEVYTTSNNYIPETKTSVISSNSANSNGVLTASGGVNYYGNQKETYYNLNMDNVVANAKAMGIEGEYWVREDGVKMYGDKVIIAANLDTYPRGSTVETSLGTGIVLDTGGFAESNPTQVDIATSW